MQGTTERKKTGAAKMSRWWLRYQELQILSHWTPQTGQEPTDTLFLPLLIRLFTLIYDIKQRACYCILIQGRDRTQAILMLPIHE